MKIFRDFVIDLAVGQSFYHCNKVLRALGIEIFVILRKTCSNLTK